MFLLLVYMLMLLCKSDAFCVCSFNIQGIMYYCVEVLLISPWSATRIHEHKVLQWINQCISI